MTKRKYMEKGFTIVLFLVGFILCCYPVISTIVHENQQRKSINTYEMVVDAISETDIEAEWKKSVEYNERLYQSQNLLLDDVNMEILETEHYEELLNVWNSGMMGSIDIPKINVYLPIYHGSSAAVLSNSIGHLEGSSLPVGGGNTRCILTGHRGLPNAKLFTRLDELEISDLFYIHILDQVLAYQIVSIDVIKPEEAERLNIIPEEDLVSLVTCTPYGINTHRLVVTGERVEYQQITYDEIEPEMMSRRELCFVSIPFICLAIVVVGIIKNEKRKRR